MYLQLRNAWGGDRTGILSDYWGMVSLMG